MNCLECNQTFNSLRGLHLHISKSHDSLEIYYQKHFCKRDLFSGDLISFKNLEDYLDRDFNSKENFALWCQKEDKEKVSEYILNALEKRIEKKNIQCLPSHIELKSIFLPSWYGLISIYGTKENASTKLRERFCLKYDYITSPEFSAIEPQILIDTREQFPLSFEGARKMKLSCGDYSTSGELFSDVFIERKSLADLVSTLSGGKERFLNEINRAKQLNYYLVVVVEDSFENVQKYGPHNSFSKAVNGKFILYNIREILQEHENVQFVFAGTRTNSIRIIKRIFQMKDQVRVYDLEYLKDFNIL